jgi:hypothetical protein
MSVQPNYTLMEVAMVCDNGANQGCGSVCQSGRIIEVGGKSSDCNNITYKGQEHNGYVLRSLNIGGGDYYEFSFCLQCGQIQDEFPVDDPEFYNPNKVVDE